MFFAFLLWIMPLLVAVLVVLYVERVKTMISKLDVPRHVFEGVSATLGTQVDNGRVEEWVAQQILETLINELVDGGWDTADEALRDFRGVPFIAQAFANCGIKLVED